MVILDWKWTVKTNIFLLHLSGLWPRDGTYKLDLYTLWTLIATILFTCGHNFFQFSNMFVVLNDLENFTDNNYITFSCLLSFIKAYSLFSNMKTLKQLMAVLHETVFNPENTRQRILIQTSMNVWKVVYIVFSFCTCGATFLLSIHPILDGSFRDGRLPFSAWYPFETQKTPIYQIVYVYQVLSIVYLVGVIYNVDTFIALLNAFVGVQCNILCDKLRNLQDTESSAARKELIGCIQLHKEILTFTEKSNRFNERIIFSQFFSSALSTGLTLFQLSVVQRFSGHFYFTIMFESSVFTQIFMYCWFGNEVEIKSNNIPYAAFEADWVNADLGFKKDLLFLIVKSQRPIKVSAMNLFYLNLNTLMTILRSSWSYYVLLRQVDSG
ncbi:unnamed protein product [Tenebrio molitor]|nr:unnamed protein product [Tenebrio molitor]